MKQTLLITTGSQWWLSVELIRQQIVAIYENLGVHVLELSENQELAREQLKRSIQKYDVQRFVFADSIPHPIHWIECIQNDFQKTTFEWVFHLYGNFAIHSPEWAKTLKLLQGNDLRIIVSSQAQQGQVLALLGSQFKKNVFVCPFPISRKTIPWQKRQKHRSHWKIAKDEFAVCSIGRISLMKNVDQLIRLTDLFARQNPKRKIKLFIAGEFDDFGSNFVSLQQNEFFQLWNAWYDSVDLAIRDRIEFLGFLDPEQRDSLILACDLLANLSTFHDEDFGLAPLEALTQGLPCLLTGWGGFIDFASKERQSVRLVDVRIDRKGLKINDTQFINAMRYFSRNPRSLSQRKNLGHKFQVLYSLKTIKIAYQKIYKAKVSPLSRGPLDRIQKFAKQNLLWRQGRRALYPKITSRDEHYMMTYRSYFNR